MAFAPNPNWSRFFAPGPEIYRYLRDTAAGLGRDEHLSPDTEVVQQRWDSEAGVWHLAVKGAAIVSARFVVNSVGGYVNAEEVTGIPGLDDFAGTVLRPNAWDDDYVVRGKRVAVIGIGSSGVQIAAALRRSAPASTSINAHRPGCCRRSTFDIPPSANHHRVPPLQPPITAHRLQVSACGILEL